MAEDYPRPAPMRKDPEAMALLERVTRLIAQTSRDDWWEGPTFRSPCGTKHCVLSHVAEAFGTQVMEEFEATWSSSYVIGFRVNDKPTARYPQRHPKDRVMAYLHNLATGEEPDLHESMWRDYQHSEKLEAANNRIDAYEAATGITLLDWQRLVVIGVLTEQSTVVAKGRQYGWTTIQNILDAFRREDHELPPRGGMRTHGVYLDELLDIGDFL